MFRSPQPLEWYEQTKLSASSTPAERYGVYATFALTRFQLLEQELRVYMLHTIHRLKLPISDETFLKWSLTKLVAQFNKFNGDKGLAVRLNKLVPLRNYVAHEGFIESPEGSTILTPSMISYRLKRMKKIAELVEGAPYAVSLVTKALIAPATFLRPMPVDPNDAVTTGVAGIH